MLLNIFDKILILLNINTRMIDPQLLKLIVAIGVFGVNKTNQYRFIIIISTFISLFLKLIEEKGRSFRVV